MTEDIARAIHMVLSQNSSVQDGLGAPPRLYDAAPDDPIFPYLSYGPLRSEDIGGDDVTLFSHQMTLHIWSRYAGRAEVFRLLNAVKAVLEDAEGLSVHLQAETLVSATILYADVLHAPDGRTQHGLLRLSLLTEPAFATEAREAA